VYETPQPSGRGRIIQYKMSLKAELVSNTR
jgi:hypothetical protein